MEVEFPQIILPLVVATVLLFGGLFAYGGAMQLIVRRDGEGHPTRFQRSGILEGHRRHGDRYADHGGWHLIQIALWAVAFLVCGSLDLRDGFLPSAQDFTAFGYGDVRLSERWRSLNPLEATNGLLFFGMSTAVLFALMSQLIAKHLQTETGYQSEAAGNQAPWWVAGDARSR